jgi:collagenase-like PrtC family protease
MSKEKAFIKETFKQHSFKPELLSPAGSLKNLRSAFAYGVDAVYAGQPRPDRRETEEALYEKFVEMYFES